MRSPKIVPSVLNANQAALGDACKELEAAGVDAIQWDVMDGHFVPNLTFGADVIKACRTATSLMFEAHLMIENAERYIEDYVNAGCEIVIVHPEAQVHLHRTLNEIRRLGAGAGVALNPHTPLELVRHVLGSVDHLLVMTVNPGFGGQQFIKGVLPKVRRVRELIDRARPGCDLEVDGGIEPHTIGEACKAGARVFVAGSAIFGAKEGITTAMHNLL
ncbi:MAG: ribulose-phosphate 3-epimerase, partial [Actinomycetota bacterium]